jgi:kinesin family member 2/24
LIFNQGIVTIFAYG